VVFPIRSSAILSPFTKRVPMPPTPGSLLSQAVTKDLSVFISERDHGLSRAAGQSESENPNDFTFKPDASHRIGNTWGIGRVVRPALKQAPTEGATFPEDRCPHPINLPAGSVLRRKSNFHSSSRIAPFRTGRHRFEVSSSSNPVSENLRNRVAEWQSIRHTLSPLSPAGQLRQFKRDLLVGNDTQKM